MIFDEIAARKLGLFPDRDRFVYLSPRSWTEREDPGSEIRITNEETPISFEVFIRLIFFLQSRVSPVHHLPVSGISLSCTWKKTGLVLFVTFFFFRFRRLEPKL